MKNCYMRKFRALVFVLLFALVFALAGCTDPASETRTTDTYGETVDGVLWEVTYDTETREVVSIRTSLAILNFDRDSQFYRFMAEYTENPDVEIVRSITLSGVPVGDSVFKIEQSIRYFMSGSYAEYEAIKAYFPSCSYEEVTTTSEVFYPETGETTTVTAVFGEITFSSSTSTYEQRISFTVPAA